jgi:SAM-dependent methyltransferase
MSSAKDDLIRESVRERYGDIARKGDAGCCGPSLDCCDTEMTDLIGIQNQQSSQMGYSDEELASVPEGANMGLGCGNPQAIAALKPGETVLDLGSGAGFDSFLAARQVGPGGMVIGVDMTPDMISKARENARKSSFDNVEFRLGEIEHLPVADACVDVIISNCVINLSTDKPAVFREAYRTLKSGGRLAISDVVATAQLPEEIKNDLKLYSACVSGASTISDLENILVEIGFTEIKIEPKDESREFIREWAPEIPLEDYVQSATIEARK